MIQTVLCLLLLSEGATDAAADAVAGAAEGVASGAASGAAAEVAASGAAPVASPSLPPFQTYLDADVVSQVGEWVAYFVGFGFLVAVMMFATGYVVQYVADVARGGSE